LQGNKLHLPSVVVSDHRAKITKVFALRSQGLLLEVGDVHLQLLHTAVDVLVDVVHRKGGIVFVGCHCAL